MPTKLSADQLVETASNHMREYVKSGRTRTDQLKLAAEAVVGLREHFLLEDGRIDWSGRTPA